MISKPCPDQSVKNPIIWGMLILAAFLLTPLLHAAQPIRLDIQMEESVIQGEEISIIIRTLSLDGETLLAENRELEAEIFNGSESQIKNFDVKDGMAELHETFDEVGASMITVRDLQDSTLVEYKAFHVGFGGGQ